MCVNRIGFVHSTTRLSHFIRCNVSSVSSKGYRDIFTEHLENLSSPSINVGFCEGKHCDLVAKPRFAD